MRRVTACAVAAVLGAACTGDRTPPAAGPVPQAKPICDRMPAGVPAGFVLTKTKRLPSPEFVAVRREYRDPGGRLLVYLLGVMGEVGEGAPVAEEVTLADGTEADLLGGPIGNWAITWLDEPPCPQMSVVGNGFSREEFEALMTEIGLLSSGAGGEGQGYTEWLAVFDVARRAEGLDPTTEELLDTAGMDHIAVGQASCWKGLPRKLGVGLNSVVAAVYGPGEAELDEVVAAVGREPIFRGELEAFCVD
ncbi:MAG: hypothetical protein ACRDH9_03005 [Actinomycetota bacterium]